MRPINQELRFPCRDIFVAPASQYILAFFKSLLLFGFVILMLGRYANGTYRLGWTPFSWYIVGCALLFAPTQIATTNLKRRLRMGRQIPFPRSKVPVPRAMIYAAGLPLMPLKDYSGSQVHLFLNLMTDLLKFILGPVILAILFLTYDLKRILK